MSSKFSPFRNRLLLLTGLVCLAAPGPGVAQTPVPAATPAPEAAEQTGGIQGTGEIRRVRGVVAFVSRTGRYFHLLTGSQAEGFRVNAEDALPLFSQEVEVEYNDASGRSGGWDAKSIRNIGPGQLPAPIPCTPDDALAGTHNRRWVQVEGVVLQVKYATGFLWIQLAGKGGWGMANVYDWPTGPLGDQWWGARVRIRGLNIGKGQNAFRVPSPEMVEILTPGLARPFDLPETPMAKVAALPGPQAERVKIRATILGEQAGVVYMRSGGIALQADLMYPFDSNQEPSGRFLEAPKIPWRDRGDEMEVIGSPLQIQPYVRLQLAQFKVVKRLAGVEPRAVSVAEAAGGAAANDLVVLRGRLSSRHETGAGPLRRETLELIEGNRAMPVILDSRTGGILKHLQLQDLVQATGIVEPAPGTPPWVVRLTGVQDVKSFGLAPEVARGRLWQRIGWVGGGAFALAGLAAVSRHRQQRSRHRVAVIRQQNAALEQRVAERTAELEVARDELKRALEQERELGELKSRFVSTVSHEFRTPLGIILSAVELLQNYSDRLPGDQKLELMQDVRTATLRMASMMEQVLVLGRAEAGKLEFRSAPLNLPLLAGNLIEEISVATQHHCPIEWKTTGTLEGAMGDEALFRHILSNLLSNAVKYSPAGSIVRMVAERQGPDLLLSVIDHGIGVPEADHTGIFEAFQRGSNVGELPGTGLGLVIVQRCVELHRGTISLQSSPGQGSTFSVKLPLFPGGPT